MPVIDFLERNVKLYGNETALVELNPEMKDTRRMTWKDYADAFRRYVRFLSQGGEKVFTDLLQEAGLRSPFEEGALAEVAKECEALLENLEKTAGI